MMSEYLKLLIAISEETKKAGKSPEEKQAIAEQWAEQMTDMDLNNRQKERIADGIYKFLDDNSKLNDAYKTAKTEFPVLSDWQLKRRKKAEVYSFSEVEKNQTSQKRENRIHKDEYIAIMAADKKFKLAELPENLIQIPVEKLTNQYLFHLPEKNVLAVLDVRRVVRIIGKVAYLSPAIKLEDAAAYELQVQLPTGMTSAELLENHVLYVKQIENKHFKRDNITKPGRN